MRKLDSPKRDVLVKLTITSRQIIQRFDRYVEEMGLSRAKFGVMAIAATNPGATQRVIAEKLEVTEVTAGRLVERLCADGYVDRRESEEDRRARSIHLTPTAEILMDQLGEIAAQHEDETLAGFSSDEIATLAGLLGRIADNVAEVRSRQAAADTSEPAADRATR